MKNVPEITSALSLFSSGVATTSSYVLTTQHFYPSNKFVSISVESVFANEFRITDSGGAMDYLASHGFEFDSQKKFFASSVLKEGLYYLDGAIVADRITLEAIPSAISLVAKISTDVAAYGMKLIRKQNHKNVEQEIFLTLNRFFSHERIFRSQKIVGASNRQYTFGFVVPLVGEQKLVIDAVFPEPASLNAKVVSHLDVARAHHGAIQQQIVFDDSENWRSSDLALLQMAATVVPLSSFQVGLNRLFTGSNVVN